MKKRLFALVSLALALLMLLAGCGKTETASIGDFLQSDAKYTPSIPTVQRGDILSSLTATNVKDTAIGPYLHLTDTGKSSADVKHIVFNAETEETALFLTEPEGVDYEITVCESEMGAYFFLVAEEKADKVTKSLLYNVNGKVMAEAEGEVTPQTTYDMIRFDGKCYVANGDGLFSYSFDYPDMMTLPSFFHVSDTYYYEASNYGVNVYDKTLRLVSSYALPAGASLIAHVVMPDGGVLLQHQMELTEDAEEYDLILTDNYYGNTSKLALKTLVLNAKTGKTKEMKLDYYLYMRNDVHYMGSGLSAKETGMSEDAVHALVPAYAIENKRVTFTTAATAMLVMDKKGSLSCLDKVGGEVIQGITLIADGRFLVKGAKKSFVINRQGKVLGMLESVRHIGEKFFSDNKVFDADFNLVFDLTKEGYTLEATLANGLLLRDSAGNLAMYGEGEHPVTVCRAGGTKSHVYTSSNFVVIEDRSEDTYYDFYNENGENVLTVPQSYYTSGLSFFQSVNIHYSKDGVTVLSALGSDGLTTYYILH